ncbi:MAG: DUF4365 domain-containing protein [Lewinellaceae bacterium]|nr:DUF4365 domain-containing protein [Saprospiraceae bacterium]MCB9340910.1 DUF4365 domain-containing protein [Lewinellaceae bacterium]
MKKRRSPSHVLAALGVNFVERQTLLAGYFFERKIYDYSTDGTILTFDENDEVETGWIYVQVKSSEKLKRSKQHQAFEISLEKRDLELWLGTIFPFILVLYEASSNQGYFLDLQKYFSENRIILRDIHKFKQVFVAHENIFDQSAVEKLRKLKNETIG